MAEEMGEVLGIEFGETLTIVDGLAHDEHRGEGKLIIVDDLGEVFEHTPIDLLIGPCEMITGCNRSVLRILL